MSLIVEAVATTRLVAHPANPRMGDVGAISDSLRAHGQYRPIVVQREGGVVLAGNHTLLAAKALGWTEIDVVFVDVDDDEALRILLVDNRLSDLAAYDDNALVELLLEITATADGFTGTGYAADDLDALVADLNTQLPEVFARINDGASHLAGHQEHRCPSCDYQWSGSCTPGE